MKNTIIKRSIQILALSVLLFSCSKDPGEGGNSSIYGSVWVKNYNSTFTVLNGEYEGADEDVYIIYGDGNGYSDKVSANYKGVYEFKYLRPGKYTIYIYSKDSTLQSPSGKIPIIKEVEITEKKQEIEVPEITIFN
jgi:hypothetical protein